MDKVICKKILNVSTNNDNHMRKIKTILVLIVLLAIFSVAVLTSCSSVTVQEIRLSENSQPKTEYLVDEEINLENIFIDVVRTDMKVTSYSLIENLGLFTVSNFSSSAPATNLPVVIRYKDAQVSFHVNINSPQSIDSLRDVRLHLGFNAEHDTTIQKPFGSVLEESELRQSVPEREGYIFDGWYKDSSLTNEYNFFADRIYEQTDLFAKWAKIHKVRFLIQPEDDENNLYSNKIYLGYRVVAEYNVKDSENIEVPPQIPQRVGKRGVWSPSLFVNIDRDINAIVSYSDVFLSASFKYRDIISNEYEVLGVIRNIPYGTNLKTDHSESLDAYYKDFIIGYTSSLPTNFPPIVFSDNWEDAWAASGIGSTMDNMRQDTEFVAIAKNRKVNINFNLNYNVDPSIYHSTVVEYKQKIPKPLNPEREGFAFEGWFKDSETTEPWHFATALVESQGSEVINNMHLYAKWTKLHRVSFEYQPEGLGYEPYNIFISAEDGSELNYTMVKSGTNYHLPKVPDIKGHIVSWDSTSVTLIDRDRNFRTNIVKQKYNVTFYDADNNPVAAYDDNEGNPVLTQIIEYKDAAIAPSQTPSKFGYIFESYSDSYESVESNLELRPIFSPEEISITFDFDYDGHKIFETGQFGVSIQDVEPSENKNRLGYNFKGWTKNKATGEIIDISQPIDQLEDIDLYAVWKAKYTLIFEHFESDGSIYLELIMEEGDIINPIRIPNAEDVAKLNNDEYGHYSIGYDFIWVDENGNEAIETLVNNPLSKNHQFKVSPELKKYQIEFLIDGNKTRIPPKTIEHGKRLSTISDFPTYSDINNVILNFDLIKFEQFTQTSLWIYRGREYTYSDLLENIITNNVVIEPKLTLKTFLVEWKESATSADNIYETRVPFDSKAIYNGPEQYREGHILDYWAVILRLEGETAMLGDRAESERLTLHVKKDLVLLPRYKLAQYDTVFIDGYDKSQITDKVRMQYGQVIYVDNSIISSEDTLDKQDKLYSGWMILSGQQRKSVGRYYDRVQNERFWQLSHSTLTDLLFEEIASPLIIYKSKYYVIPANEAGNISEYLNSIDIYLPEVYSSIVPERRLKLVSEVENGWRIGDEVINAQIIRFVGQSYEENGYTALNKDLYFIVQDETVFESSYEDVVFNVDFNISGEELVNPQEFNKARKVKYNTPVLKPADPIPVHSLSRIFLGWYTDSSYTNRWADFSRSVEHDMTLYARWDDIRHGTPEAVTYVAEPDGVYAIATSIDPGKVGLNGEIEIANYYRGIPVREIADYAFASGKDAVRSFSLPNTLMSIGAKAFSGLVHLEHVFIPALVKNIGVGAFDNCINLKSVEFEIGSELTTIGTMAFYNAKLLKYGSAQEDSLFKLPSSLNIIQDYAFYGCEQLKGLVIPEGVTDIGDSAFENCKNLNYIFIDTIAPPYIGSNAFEGQEQQNNTFKIYVKEESLNTYSSSQLIENNPEWAAYVSKVYSKSSVYYKDLKPDWSYVIEKDDTDTDVIVLLQYLGEESTVIVPSELEGHYLPISKVVNYAFGFGITKIEISLDVLTEKYTFSSANDLENIKVVHSNIKKLRADSLIEAYNLPYIYKIEVATNSPLNELFGGGANIPAKITEVEIYSSFTRIADNFFQDCDYVERVVFYSTASIIGQQAFANMRSLREVVIIEAKRNESNIEYSKIERIEEGAFRNSARLASFKYMLGGTSELLDGIIPHAFIIDEAILEGTHWLNDFVGEVVVIGDNILYKYIGAQEDAKRKYVLPSTIKQIAPKAFYGVSNLESIIPENIDSSDLSFVGSRAFANMPLLEMVIFPNNMNSIITVRDAVFENSKRLSVIVWGAKGAGVLSESLRYYFYEESNALPRDEVSTGVQKSAVQLYFNKDYIDSWQASQIFREVNSRGYTSDSLSYQEVENEIAWVYADVAVPSSTNYEKTLIKYLAESSDCTVIDSVGIGNYPVLHYGGYVLSRNLRSAHIKANIAALRNSFNDIYRLEDLSISGGISASQYKLIGEKIAKIIDYNFNITSLSLNGVYSIDTLLNNQPLNNRIKTINILPGSNLIANRFLYDVSSIEYINILSEKNGTSYSTPLENLVPNLGDIGIVINSIGSKAFWNTSWINRYNSDYIVVLNNVLVDYKGTQSVLDLSKVVVDGSSISINSISSSAFENNTNIEVLYLPNTLSYIGENGFRGANKLTKIFVTGQGSSVPEITSTVFESIGGGYYSVYAMNSTILTALQGNSSWNNLHPRLVPMFIETEGEKWLSNRGGNAYLYVYITQYLIDGTTPNSAVLEWQKESLRKYSVTNIVEGLEYDLSTLDLVEEVELEKIIVPYKLTHQGQEYTITKILNNAFLNTADEIGFRIDVEFSTGTFANLSHLGSLHLISQYMDSDGVAHDIPFGGPLDEDSIMKAKREILQEIISSKGVNNIIYNGNYTLDHLLMLKSDDVQIRPANVTSVEISHGSIETVDKMLSKWSNISHFSISETVQKLGVLSLEDTAWYQNSGSYVIVGDILYKYKGLRAQMRINIPEGVNIINTGAFSKPRSDSTSWNTDNDWESADLVLNTINFGLTSKATSILPYAFAHCTNLNVFNAPYSLSNISPSAFIGTSILTQGDFIYVADEHQRLTLLKYTGQEESVTLNLSVKSIADRAFANCASLKILTVPVGSILETIGSEAFIGTGIINFYYDDAQNGSTLLRSVGKDAFPQNSPLNKKYFKARGGKNILYNDPNVGVAGLAYTIDDDVISITEGAIKGYSEIILNSRSLNIPASEMKSVLSNLNVKTFTSYGIYSMAEIIGSHKPLENIEEIKFLDGTLGVAPGFVKDWHNVKKIESANASIIQRIGEGAFTGTQYLVEREITAKLQTNGFAVFGSGILIAYSGGANVILGSEIRIIMSDVFRDNKMIESVDLSATIIKEIPAHAFEGCTSLSNISLPNDIVSIGEKAFYNTAWLENQAEDLIIINGQLIAYKGGVNVLIDKNVKKINPYVFSGSSSIVKVEFAQDNSIEYIEPYMFANCSSLETVVLNKNIERIAPNAFLNTIYQSRNRSIYYIENPQDPERLYKKLILTTIAGDYEFDNQVIEVGKYAFNDAKSITGVTISSSSKLTILPDGLFENCDKIARINISKQGILFGKNLFNKNIPYRTNAQANSEGFVILGGSYLLEYKGRADTVIIPKNVKYLSEHCFVNYIRDKGEFNPAPNPVTGTIPPFVLVNPLTFDFNRSLVKRIPEGMFKGVMNLTTVNLDKSYIEIIGKDAFYETTYYDSIPSTGILGSIVARPAGSSINVPATIKYIPENFFNDTGIQKVTFNGPVVIGSKAFANCSNLTEIINPHHIISIGVDAFEGNSNLDNLIYDGNTGLRRLGNIIVKYTGPYETVTIASSVTRISAYSFANNKSIKHLIFEPRDESSPTLHIEEGAFKDCENLETVDFSPVASKILYLANDSFSNTMYYKNLISTSSPHVVVDGVLLLLTSKPAILSIPQSVNRIVGGLAKNNYSIARIEIYQSITSGESQTLTIGEEAFYNAMNLRARFVSALANEIIEKGAFSLTPWESSRGKLIVSEKGQVLAYKPTEYETNILLTALSRSIYPYVLKNNKAITTIDMRNSNVKSIEKNIFEGCSNLTGVQWSLEINFISKQAIENTAWYESLADAPYIYNHKLLLVKGATSTNCTLNDASIYKINKGSLDEFTTLTFGAYMSTELNNPLVIDDGSIDHIQTITVASERLTYFKDRFPKYESKFITV